MVDGSSRLGAFIRVTLPLAAPGLAATAVFIFFVQKYIATGLTGGAL